MGTIVVHLTQHSTMHMAGGNNVAEII